MSNLQIQLDPVALREATSQAIMGILTPEIRAQIIQDAIKALLAPSTNSWEKNRSPLQMAFDNAVQQVAREVAVEEIKNNAEITEKVRGLMREVSAKVLNTEPETLVQRMADAFVSSMRSRD